MKNILNKVTTTLCVLLLLSACSTSNTPQEVAAAFWQAVLKGDSSGAVKYSTLTDEQQYDAFARDWRGLQPSWGRVVIDGDKASIETELSPGANTGENTRKLVTYLVHDNQHWKVDYAQTRNSVKGGSLGMLFEQLGQLGDTLADQFRSSSEDLEGDIERLSEEFAEMSDQAIRQAAEHSRKYEAQLRQNLDELSDSVQRALDDHHDQLSPDDQDTMNDVIDDLNKASENLSTGSPQAISESGEQMASAQQQLAKTDDRLLGKYKEDWRNWGQRFEADMRQQLEQLLATARDEP